MPATRRLLRNELENLLDNSFLLTKFKLRVHGQREDFRCDSFGHGEIPFLMAEICIGFLLMEWCRVVNLASDVSLSKMGLELIAVLNPDHI